VCLHVCSIHSFSHDSCQLFSIVSLSLSLFYYYYYYYYYYLLVNPSLPSNSFSTSSHTPLSLRFHLLHDTVFTHSVIKESYIDINKVSRCDILLESSCLTLQLSNHTSNSSYHDPTHCFALVVLFIATRCISKSCLTTVFTILVVPPQQQHIHSGPLDSLHSFTRASIRV